MFAKSVSHGKPPIRLGVLAVTAVILSACSVSTGNSLSEGIGYREARFAEISAVREYRKCRDNALELDRQAREGASPARYLASARLLEKCEAELGPEAAGVAVEERLRAYALSVQDHFKGGDVVKARENLERFKQSFPDKDLFFKDGSSFVETMEILLGLKDRSMVGEFSVANVNSDVKSELRRVRYWKRN